MAGSSRLPQTEMRRGLPQHFGGKDAMLVVPAENARFKHAVQYRQAHARLRRSSTLNSSMHAVQETRGIEGRDMRRRWRGRGAGGPKVSM